MLGGALALILILLLGLVLFACWPLRLEVSGKAQGARDGGWVAGGGIELGFVAVACVAARGVAPSVTVQLFGLRCYEQKLLAATPRVPEAKNLEAARPKRNWRPRVTASEALDFSLKLVSERRHFRLRYLALDLEYGFRDPILTGRLFGALCALSGALPAPLEIRQRPRWDFEDGWELSLDARAQVRPLLVVFDLGCYVVRMWWQRWFEQRKAAAANDYE